MNKKVYSYLLRTYGRLPGVWVSVALLIVQTLLMRVVSVIIIAGLAGQVVTGNYEAAKTSAFTYLGVALVGIVLRMLREIIALRAENAQYGQVTLNYYRTLINKDMSFFRDNQTGYLATTYRQHADSGLELVRMFRGEIAQAPITLIAPTAVLFIASWQVGLIALAVIIAQFIYITWASSTAHKFRARSHEIYRKISGVFADDITNIVAHKTSGNPEASIQKLSELSQEEQEIFWLRKKRLALLDMPRDIITVTGTAVAFWLIVSSAESTALSVGLVVMTVSYMFQIFQSVSSLPDMIAKHDDLVTRIYPTLDYITPINETIRDPQNPQPFNVGTAAISIRNVSFGYPDEKGNKLPVFKDLNISIAGGEQVGIVGLSGAGKSTLASLLMRFDDIDSGSISIDGTDIRDVRQADLRKQIAYVPQEPLLFHRSIKENLLYFSDNATHADMVRATQAAHAEEFIAKLPRGYDTMVGERGIKLSGGQKQRIVIARAILKNAAIMLFDEATSALDSESEKIIQNALPEIIGKRTAIVIAHRLSTVAGLDRIIVMHDGKVVEQGSHTELLALKGRYHSLWQKQTAQELELS